MAMNPLPLIALAGAALLLMKSKEDDDDVAGEGTGTDTTGFGIACEHLLGIYEFRTSANPLPDLDPSAEMRGGTNLPELKELPLTLDAFQKLRQSMISSLDADYDDPNVLTNALIAVSKGRPTGASTSGDLDCGWAVSMARDEVVADWSAKQKEVYKAAKKLLYRIECANMYGVWHEQVGNNLPVTKEFFDEMTAKFTALKATDPSADKDLAVIDALESGKNTRNCKWVSPATVHFTDRQKDVYAATKTIFDQVFA